MLVPPVEGSFGDKVKVLRIPAEACLQCLSHLLIVLSNAVKAFGPCFYFSSEEVVSNKISVSEYLEICMQTSSLHPTSNLLGTFQDITLGHYDSLTVQFTKGLGY